jgi:hypothetical protein
MHGNRLIGASFAILAGGCLLLTGWIMHRSGALQGATEDGRWALGLAAIAVHLGLAVCGLAMFVSSSWRVSAVCGVMMLGAAACSAWQIATFMATEVISVNMAREAAEKRENERAAAALEMARERQKTQAEMAKGTLKWMHQTERRADGRRERKDSFEAATKLVTDFGKVDAPAPLAEPKAVAPQLQSGRLAQWLAARLGYDEMMLQASPSLLIALMLLVSEVAFWPLASWFWNRPAPIEIGPFPPAGPVPREPPQVAPPAALGAPQSLKALPAPIEAAAQDEPPPKPPHPSKAPAPAVRPRQPVSEAARAALDAVDYPWIKPVGPALEQPLSAERFAAWLRAFGMHGTHDWRRLYALYREACAEFHCEAMPYNTLAALLDNRRLGVAKKRPGGGETTWEVAPFRPKRAALGEPEPAPETPSKQAERIADATPVQEGRLIRGPFPGAAPASARPGATTRPDGNDLAWLRRQQKELRALRIARNRKQRGSITMRARAA